MCSQCSDIIANNFTPTESSPASNIPRAPSSPWLLRAGISQLLRERIFFWCGSKWNIFSTKCKITCVVSWLMFSVSEWKDQAAVRSSSPEVWRPGLIQALKIWIESVSAAFNCSSDNYRLSQETSTPVPDSITQSHASPKITIAVNKVKLILLSLCYSKEKGEADFTTQHPIESKPQGELLVELELGISFFSQDVVMDALNFKTNKQNHILCLLSLL